MWHLWILPPLCSEAHRQYTFSRLWSFFEWACKPSCVLSPVWLTSMDLDTICGICSDTSLASGETTAHVPNCQATIPCTVWTQYGHSMDTVLTQSKWTYIVMALLPSIKTILELNKIRILQVLTQRIIQDNLETETKCHSISTWSTQGHVCVFAPAHPGLVPLNTMVSLSGQYNLSAPTRSGDMWFLFPTGFSAFASLPSPGEHTMVIWPTTNMKSCQWIFMVLSEIPVQHVISHHLWPRQKCWFIVTSSWLCQKCRCTMSLLSSGEMMGFRAK